MKTKTQNLLRALPVFLALAPHIECAQLQVAPQAQQVAPSKLVPAFGWDVAKQGGFATCVAVDSQNNVWAGTEGNGLWRYDPGKKQWTQFTAKDGLGDDCIYALAADKAGRVWAGHLNHGVSVFNGDKWRNYGIMDGPLGARVYAIATCPADGDVWIATDCGAARYSIANDDWDYFTTASGLPSNQVQSVAFDADGNIYLGTQCDGVAMADRKQKYAKWSVARGVDQLPDDFMGMGLTSSMINGIACLLPAKNAQFQSWPEMLYVGTPLGIAVSGDRGDHFIFIHGADWEENEKGLMNPPAAPAANLQGGPVAVGIVVRPRLPAMGGFASGGREMALARVVVQRAAQLNMRPQEDWVSCMRGDNDAGKIWIGYRSKGLEARDFLGTMVRYDTGGATVRAIWTGAKTPVLIALYDGKNGGLKMPDGADADISPVDPPKDTPALPSPAKPPVAADMLPLVKHLDVYQNDLKPGDAVFFGDDWNTGGDWVNHYGNSYAALYFSENGAGKNGDAPSPYEREAGFKASVDIGPHKKDADARASYVSENNKTDDPRALYSPRLGHRSEGGVRDIIDTQKYPASWEGPDLWLDIEVPEGEHYVSLYFQNYDAQEAPANALRDYEIQFLHPEETRENTLKGAPLAHARVSDFRGGVYKMFLVVGPAKYAVRVARDRSSVTGLQGLFIDHYALFPEQKPLPGFDAAPYGPVTVEIPPPEENPNLDAAESLWDKLTGSLGKRGVAEMAWPFNAWAYRAAAGAKARAALLANWRWGMGVWDEDRAAFDKAMADAFKAYSEKEPGESHEEKK